MPDEWQIKFVALLEELETEYAHLEQADGYEVNAGSWQYVNECTPTELKIVGVTCSDDEPDDKDEAGEEAEGDYETRYYKDGGELQGHDYVFIPGADPVPHYQRGRAYIPPASVLREAGMEPAG